MARPEKLSRENVHYIVQRFIEAEKGPGKIQYRDVFEFQNKLYENKEILAKMDETFWRKQPRMGRLVIDEANRVIMNTVNTSNKEIKIVDVVDAIYKNINNPEALIHFIKPLEDELYSSIEREKKLVEKLGKTNQLLLEEKEKNTKLEQKNEQLQGLIYQIFDYSASTDNDIVNLMRTGLSRNQLVNEALKNAFSDPLSYFKTMQGRKAGGTLKVVGIQEVEKSKGKEESSMLDDYGYF